AQVVVVFGAAHRISPAFYGNDLALGVGNVGGELIQRFLGLLRKVVFVEAEVHGGFGYHVIVVQIRHGVLQRVDAMHGVIGQTLALIGLLAGGQSFLVDFSGLGLDCLNPRLRAGIDVLDGVGIFGGQIVQLVGLVDQRSGLLT